jgi:hypothetical protein
MTTTTTRNVSLTVNGQTIVRPLSHLPGLRKLARRVKNEGKLVVLKSTDAPVTDLLTGLQVSNSCEDCECCGAFGARHYWIETEFGNCAWACLRCVGIQSVRKMAKSA